MEVIVLGNNGPYPSAGGACSSYLVRSGNTSMLNDCGPGSLANLFKYMDPKDLDAILVSHLHYDHISDLYALGYYLKANNKQIDLFLPDSPRDVYETFRDNDAYNTFIICDCNMFHIKDITISFCEMTHSSKSFACKFRDDKSMFVFTGDTDNNEKIKDYALDSDLLIVDGGNAKSHLTPLDCDLLSYESNAKQFVVSHLNPSFDNEKLFEHRLAKIGDVYKLD